MEKAHIPLTLGRRKKLEQDLEHVTQEMYKRNLELSRTNKMLSVLRIIDGLVLEPQGDLQALCQQICTTIVDNYDYPFVAIFAKDMRHEQLHLLGWGANGNSSKLDGTQLSKAYLDTEDNWYKESGESKLVVLQNLTNAKLAKDLHITEHSLRTLRSVVLLESICLIKLIARQHVAGVMAVSFNHHMSELPMEEAEFLERLGSAVGVAVDNKLLFEENQHVLGQLQHTNDKLRLLDQTKDDFISMASHQLRTPLTSVKGYLSMVLEGDGGELNRKQEKMLNQAFISSQRMVYLIADLLNVSRLRTGKFVIEPSPVNLAEIIQSEVGQLVETAMARGLKLVYEKPDDFPTLLLDETKIRQVIMNFIDNAIYYTPSGGRIEVSLGQTQQSITLSVKDDGIGVPKHEQHHLFTKFYRAHNARKARPDGTGLGLFMAKKVIIAQGGSIVFKSHEGKGSTFGFTFAKARLRSGLTSPGPHKL